VAPDGWADRSDVTLVAPGPPGEGAPSLVVTADRVPAATDARGLARLQHAGLRASQVYELEVIASARVDVGGVPAVCRTYRWRIGEHAMRQRLWCLVAGGVGYTITASAPDERFDELAPQFEAAVASFRLDA
jgi:hypothetical protein